MTTNRREFLKAAGALPAALGGKDAPNILTIMCDQLNASVTSTYGGPVATPNLTRLARSGVLFTQATGATALR
ncbi:MAG: sulfatase-like hydrolase/transferase [Acidobacteria bacterium]|nr:sulfatase-like hydrolase/transferase [Acidobacteriota bacterium]